MHATDHKHDACQVPAWKRRNADRTCEHGDTALKAAAKRTARKARRSDDKREAQR